MTPATRPSAPAVLRLVFAGLLAVALSACASAAVYPGRPPRGSLPAGSPLLSRSLAEGDAWLRYYLLNGQYDSALAMLAPRSKSRPRDELQRHLQLGSVLHYAGRFAESNRALEWAEREADNRYTKSVSRGAGALLVNDGVLRYVPTASEMAMIPYFRLKNYLALGDTLGALVEARKAGQRLSEQADGAEGCAGDGFLRYLSGMVFDAGRERADAAVALRMAERDFDRCREVLGSGAPAGFGLDLVRAARAAGLGEVADSAAARYGVAAPPAASSAQAEGDVLLLVEHGFVVHRTPRELYVPVPHADLDGVDRNDSEGVGEATARVAARLLGSMNWAMMWGSEEWGGGRRWALGGDSYLMKISWPGYRLESSRVAAVRLYADDAPVAVNPVENVSARVLRDFEAAQPLVVARAVGRALSKYLVTRELEKVAEKKGGETAGFFAFNLANLAGNLLEQADTRSWTLLPDEISLARLTLPAGEHHLRLEALSGDGRVIDTLDLGTFDVRAGERIFLSRRVWGADPGDWRPLARMHPAATAVDSAALAGEAP
jgi:hypothetical protein